MVIFHHLCLSKCLVELLALSLCPVRIDICFSLSRFARYVLIQWPILDFKNWLFHDNIFILKSLYRCRPWSPFCTHWCASLPLHIHTSFSFHLFKLLKPLHYNLASLLLFLVDANCHWNGGTDPNIFSCILGLLSPHSLFCISPGSHSEKTLKFEQRGETESQGQPGGPGVLLHTFVPENRAWVDKLRRL